MSPLIQSFSFLRSDRNLMRGQKEPAIANYYSSNVDISVGTSFNILITKRLKTWLCWQVCQPRTEQ